jgi:hypothetical protein
VTPADYMYLGDRITRAALKNKPCSARRRADGKCIRGRNGNMSVVFEDGQAETVLAKRLRKVVPHG